MGCPRYSHILSLAAVVLLAPAVAQARTKLVTLPARDVAHLRLDHAQFVLVQEERTVALQRGRNQIDFSWQNVNIDPGSIQFQALTDPDQVSVLSVSFPPEGNSLIWDVDSVKVGAEQIRVSYLVRGFEREIMYRGVVDNAEQFMTFRSYLKVRNNSGESFDDAHIAVGYGAEYDKSIENGEAKEMLSYTLRRVPVRKTFTYEFAAHPEQVRLHYVIPNSADVGLGGFALRSGKARLFQEDSTGTTAFLGEDWAAYTAVGDELELYIGDSRDVVVKRHKMSERRLNERRNRHGQVVLYDLEEKFKLEIENFRPTPVTLTVIEHLQDSWSISENSHPFEVQDYQTVEFTVSMPPKGDTVLLEFTVIRANLQ